MPVRITKSVVDAAGPVASTRFLWDAEERGFGLRITSNGVKSFVYQYRMGGREQAARRTTIGKNGSPWTADAARKEARRLAMLVASGVDPIEAERNQRRLAVDLAFSAYIAVFHNQYLIGRWKDADYALARLRQHAEPTLGRKALPEISRADISRVFDALASKPAAAKLLHSILRKLFRWAVQRGDLDRSPMEGAVAPPAVEARDRVLSDVELAAVWRASETLAPPAKFFIQILVLTGARRQEVACLTWDELNQSSLLWTLPRSRSKNGVAHIVPLSTQLVALLGRLSPTSKWPSYGLVLINNNSKSFSGFGKIKARIDKEVSHLLSNYIDNENGPSTIDHWRIHDLRRTFATGLQRLGTRFEVTEAVLNHVSGAKGGIAGVYQRYDWAIEKREALQKWADHVKKLTDC